MYRQNTLLRAAVGTWILQNQSAYVRVSMTEIVGTPLLLVDDG